MKSILRAMDIVKKIRKYTDWAFESTMFMKQDKVVS